MDLTSFSNANRTRCESSRGFNHSLDSWSTSDWLVAVMGELGEAANIVKKLNRVRDNIAGNPRVRICPACNTYHRHDHVRVQKCGCGYEIGDVEPVPDPRLEAEFREKLGRELADTFVYLDLMFQHLGMDMSEEVRKVFNAKSDEIDCPLKI